MTDSDRARRLSRLRWLCRRGMKELDVLLERFCHHELDRLDAAALDDFQSLLNLEDPDLYDVLIGGRQLADPALNALANRINRLRRIT